MGFSAISLVMTFITIYIIYKLYEKVKIFIEDGDINSLLNGIGNYFKLNIIIYIVGFILGYVQPILGLIIIKYY